MRRVTDSSYIISNCRIFTRDGEREKSNLLVRDGLIDRILSAGKLKSFLRDIPIHDATGLFILPGFTELHIHGCGTIGVEQAAETPGILARMADFLSDWGCNTFLPTLPFNLPVIESLAAELEDNPRLDKRIPGIYVEGPFVNPGRRGGILPAFMEPPDIVRLEGILQAGRGRIKMMTVAPELPGAERIIRALWEADVIPCLGHSESDLKNIPSPPQGKAYHITHLFNAMSPVSHRTAGLSMLPFIDDDVYCELNSDGVHLCDEALLMCGRHLHKDRVILISDAVVSAGLSSGNYTYFGNKVVSDHRGVRYSDSDILIGSNRLVHACADHFRTCTGLGFYDVAAMITRNPQRLLGNKNGGLMASGMPADLIAVDDAYRPHINFNPY